MADLSSKVGTADYNDIFAGPEPAALIGTIKLAASQGVITRGTIVSGAAGGELKPVAAALAVTGTAADSAVTLTTPTAYVIAEDTDTGTSGAVTTFAYKTGNFARGKLKTNGTYTMTAADWEYLRGIGIMSEDIL